MTSALMVARVVLLAVFAVSGAAKLVDLRGSRTAMAGFGVPERLALPAGIALPIVELVVAVALIDDRWAWWGALGALVLLVGFIAAVARLVARGESPDCHCFGQLHSEPVSWKTAARNGVLAAVAAFVLTGGPDDVGPDMFGWVGDMTDAETAVVALLAAIAVGVAAVAYFLRQLLGRFDIVERVLLADAQIGSVVERDAHGPDDGLAVGSAAPDFVLAGAGDAEVSLRRFVTDNRPTVLVFVGERCPACKQLLPTIAAWQREPDSSLSLVVITDGDLEKLEGYDLSTVATDPDREVAEAYRANWTPAAVAIDSLGNIAAPVVYGESAVTDLIESARRGTIYPGRAGQAHTADERPGQLAVGAKAPDFVLPRLDGEAMGIADMAGVEWLVVFWNPGCSFCIAMFDDLAAFAHESIDDDPRLLVVSTGAIDDVRSSLGDMPVPVLHDPGFSIGPMFAAVGTPSAVVIRADGTVGSGVAIGAESIKALMGRTQVTS